MRFCDKLPKLRKDNNFSQEQLADKIGVSRQAISKWESGTSYPDMDKMIQLCTILNCTLEDLMDDGVIGNKNVATNKYNLNNCLQDLLKFITKTYNMFISMKLKDKIKCLLEMTCICFIMLILGAIIFIVVSNLTGFILNLLPYRIENLLSRLLCTIYLTILIILGLIIVFHLFKIRYLDYFITIEDANVSEKSLEKPIDSKKKEYVEQKKEKIIIRDPKHSTYGFVYGLARLISLFAKLLLLIVSVPFIISFVGLVFLFVVNVWHVQYNVIFLFIAVSIVGCTIINYIFLKFIYNYIVNQVQNFKQIFYLGMIGLAIFGIGIGGTFVKFINLDYDSSDLNYKIDTKEIDINSNTLISTYFDLYRISYEIDNTYTKPVLEISYIDGIGYNLHHDSESTYYHVGMKDDFVFKVYKLVLKDMKNNKIRNYDSSNLVKLKVYVNENDYQILTDNMNRIYN